MMTRVDPMSVEQEEYQQIDASWDNYDKDALIDTLFAVNGKL